MLGQCEGSLDDVPVFVEVIVEFWRPAAAATSALAGDVDVGQYFGQHRAVVALAAGDHIRQRPTATVDGTVNLGRQPTA